MLRQNRSVRFRLTHCRFRVVEKLLHKELDGSTDKNRDGLGYFTDFFICLHDFLDPRGLKTGVRESPFRRHSNLKKKIRNEVILLMYSD